MSDGLFAVQGRGREGAGVKTDSCRVKVKSSSSGILLEGDLTLMVRELLSPDVTVDLMEPGMANLVLVSKLGQIGPK